MLRRPGGNNGLTTTGWALFSTVSSPIAAAASRPFGGAG